MKARMLQVAEHAARVGGDPLTLRQRLMFDWIRMYIKRHGKAPTQADISRSFGIRPSSVWCYLKRMTDVGVIRRPWRGAHRGIEVVESRS